MVIITCKIGSNNIKKVEVSTYDPLYKLLELLQISDKNTKFIFNGETYSISCILTFREIGLVRDSKIFIVNQAISDGGGEDSVKFANLSNEFVRNVVVDPKFPDWRIIGKGINLFGICSNSSCAADGRQVIMPVTSSEYDLYGEGFLGICPMCKKHIELDTCGFYMCDYKCEGKYFDKWKDDWVDLPNEIHKTSDGKISYYDYNKSVDKKEGKVRYKKLVLKVINYHTNE